MNSTTKKITTIGMLCAMAILLNILFHFPIVPAVSFLNYDPKDIVIVIGGFIYGPSASFVMSGICAVLDIMFRGGNIIDVLMNMIATCSFCCLASYIYKKNHTKNGAIVGLFAGIMAVTISMVVWNCIVTPFYYHLPKATVFGLLLPGIIPFNLIKYGLNAGVALFLYKPVVKALRSSHLVEEGKNKEGLTRDVALVGAFIIVSLILLILSLQGII